MVGRALNREVERDVESEPGRGGGQPAHVLDGAELGVDGVVTAVLVADRPRRAGIGRPGGERVVGALAVGVADRVDRRQIDDVEAELGEPRELGLDAAQPAPRAREQLVPGAEAGAEPVGLDDLRLVDGDAAVPGHDALERLEQLLAEGDVVLGPLGQRGVLEGEHGVLDQPPVARPLGAREPLAQQHQALGHLAAEVVLAGLELAHELIAPRAEHVGPGLHGVLPAADLVELDLPRPAHTAEVGVDAVHLGLAPAPLTGCAVADDRPDQVVAVAKDVGGDADAVADAAFGRVAAVVDRRLGVLDDDAIRCLGAIAAGSSSLWLGLGSPGGRGCHVVRKYPSCRVG